MAKGPFRNNEIGKYRSIDAKSFLKRSINCSTNLGIYPYSNRPKHKGVITDEVAQAENRLRVIE